jgi:hypothetical protein
MFLKALGFVLQVMTNQVGGVLEVAVFLWHLRVEVFALERCFDLKPLKAMGLDSSLTFYWERTGCL